MKNRNQRPHPLVGQGHGIRGPPLEDVEDVESVLLYGRFIAQKEDTITMPRYSVTE
jgi:hypothetical protein